MPNYSHKSIPNLQTEDVFTVTRVFDNTDVDSFANITGDMNPIHFDSEFAQRKGFKAPICHGLLVGSMVTEIGGQLAWLATELSFSFLKPVYFGDSITCRLEIKEIRENNFAKAEATFSNQDGVVVMKAKLAGYLPSDEGRLREIDGN